MYSPQVVNSELDTSAEFFQESRLAGTKLRLNIRLAVLFSVHLWLTKIRLKFGSVVIFQQQRASLHVKYRYNGRCQTFSPGGAKERQGSRHGGGQKLEDKRALDECMDDNWRAARGKARAWAHGGGQLPPR
jgi:hypothetical protein